MGLNLKQRKFIQNSNIQLSHFDTGTEPGEMQAANSDSMTQTFLNFVATGTAPKTTGTSVIPLDKAAPALNPAAAKLNIDRKEPAAGKADVAGKVMGGVQAAMGAAQMVGLFQDAKHTDVTTAEMIGNGSAGSIDGELFQLQSLNADSAMKRDAAARRGNTIALAGTGAATGAAIGSMFGPLGGLIGGAGGGLVGLVGGLFASKKRKREAEEARRRAQILVANTNERRYDNAYTAALLKQQARRIGNDDAQELWSAEYGREPLVNPMTKLTYKQYKVDTSSGMSYDTLNGWGKKNEYIWNMANYGLHKIKRGPNDNARLHLDNNDVIFTDSIKNPFTGKTFAKSVPQAAKEGWLPELLNQQIATKRQLGFYNNNDNGKLRHAAFGWEDAPWAAGGLLTSIPGVIAGINQIQASKDDISSPKSYMAPNTQKYQNDLDSLDINMFPIYQANRDATAISNSKIAQSGGLSAGQQMLGYLTNAMNERDSISKALTNALMQRNTYRSEAAKVGIDTELRRAAQQQNAFQWDYAHEAAAHNARILNNQMGWYNLSNALGNAYKNMWDLHQFNKMYDLYAEDVNSKKLENTTTNPVQDAVAELKKQQVKTPYSPEEVSVPYAPKPYKIPSIVDVIPEDWESPSWRPVRDNTKERVYKERKLYKIGAEGDDVKLIQKNLGITETGKYDKTTANKVRAYLKSKKLNKDGIVGPITWKSLIGTPWSGWITVPYENRNHPYLIYYDQGTGNVVDINVTPYKYKL